LFDEPAAWQQHEAAFDRRVFHDFKPDAVLQGGFRRVQLRVA
jgi:hypothetical protein